MVHELLYALASVVVVSLISVIAAIPFLLKKSVSHKLLLTLLSVSVGTLLGGVFLHLLPEVIHESGLTIQASLILISGFLVFFILERLVHNHHCHKDIDEVDKGAHGHAYHLAPLNLIGDAIHNFIDGMVIAATYIISVPLGLAATVSVAFHELPQEIADMGILLYAGMKKSKAILFNLLSALTAVIGAIVAFVLSGRIHGFEQFVVPFAAGTFLYIAASNLVPELHRHCSFWETILHLVGILVGIGIMLAIALTGG
ncbi:MAG: ZIP family metal transporter [Nanoarchaeota archaeon]